MDEHQRSLWSRMLKRVSDYRSDSTSLGTLVEDLRGIFDAADIHDREIRQGFIEHWSPLDGEHDLRTQPWAPPGAADDQRLDDDLISFHDWASGVLERADDTHS